MRQRHSSWKFALTILGLAAMLPCAHAAVAKSTRKPSVHHKKKYRSSIGKPDPQAAAHKSPVKRAATKVASVPRAIHRRMAIPRGPRVSAAARAEAHDIIFKNVAEGADIPVENAAALIPFFEQLYRHQKGEIKGPLRILHYGDSHTAADEWTGDLRARFQEKFGDGGSGYSIAGRPWNGYRRLDVRTGSTRGWHTDGLVGRTGDGVYGLAGVSMSTRQPHESIYLEAEGQTFELFYLVQPGGGGIQIYDNGNAIERVSTDGEGAPGYYHYETESGTHKLEVETIDHAPVRLFGWTAENATGVTYETLGPDWMTPERLRLGASTLLNDVLMQIDKERTGAYQSPDYFTVD